MKYLLFLFTIITSLFILSACNNSTPPKSLSPIKQEALQNEGKANFPSYEKNTTSSLIKPLPNIQKHLSKEKASAFLSRATFGATDEAIKHLRNMKSYDAWFEEQFTLPATSHMEWIYTHAKGTEGVKDLADAPSDWQTYSDALGDMQLDAWWDIVVHAKDQLRQRVAFALSEILVISKYGPLVTYPDARISYYDVLVENAFANFETLLQKVTYHPAMGKYLSYLGNAKTGMLGAHPDENYAREVMQLFSIGLYKLNPDGSYQVDDKGNPLHTYTQTDVTEMAKVFTGLSDNNGEFLSEASFSSHKSRTVSMQAFERYHDKSEKKILGTTIPSNGTTKKDIDAALHILFMHPNTGVFIGQQLIQRLVTSNPSPAYIRRVAKVFNNNGKGVRGDMKAVVKAILLDKEALNGAQTYPKTFGKFREPLLYVSHLLRAFHAKNGKNILYQGEQPLYRYRSFNLHETGILPQEGPLSSLTVFNYFTPDDAPFTLKQQNLVAPELKIYGKGGIDDFLMGLIHQNDFVYTLYKLSADLQLQTLEKFLTQKAYTKAIDYLNTLLCGGALSKSTKTEILGYLKAQKSTEPKTLARHLLALVMVSPDYALQR